MKIIEYITEVSLVSSKMTVSQQIIYSENVREFFIAYE